MQNKVTLYIDINLYGLETKNIKFKFITSSLDAIDKISYSYLNEEEFFAKKKADILKRLRLEASLYGINIMPTDIELGVDRIYIEKEDKKIRPLFQEIQIKDSVIKLEDLIKKRMLEGTLFNLYYSDKKRQINPEYESIFAGIPNLILLKIEMNFITEEDIGTIWKHLKTKNRIYPTMRLLLFKSTPNVMHEKACTEIPLVEYPQKIEKDESPKRERYRYPYNDD